MKHSFAFVLVVCVVGCGVDSPFPADEHGTLNAASEDLQFHPNWNACTPPTACLTAAQCGGGPMLISSIPATLVQCGPNNFCCIPPPPPPPPRTYRLALDSIHCLSTDDAVGYDEPRLYANDTLVWSSEHFYSGETTTISGIPHIPFNNGDIYLKLQEWDAWPGSTDTLRPLTPDGRIPVPSQGSGPIFGSMIFDSHGAYEVFYSIFLE